MIVTSSVVRCPRCAGLFYLPTLVSSSNAGGIFWSDCSWQLPLSPRPEPLVRCPLCSALEWRESLELLRTLRPGEQFMKSSTIPDEWRNLSTAGLLTAADYQRAITELELGDRAREVRMLAWWTSNDPLRGQEQVGERSQADLANMSALTPLLEPGDPGDRVMRAAVLQEAGRFEEASALVAQELAEDLPELLLKTRAIIAELAASRSLRIVKVHEPEQRPPRPSALSRAGGFVAGLFGRGRGS